jgi:hypothetical protein
MQDVQHIKATLPVLPDHNRGRFICMLFVFDKTMEGNHGFFPGSIIFAADVRRLNVLGAVCFGGDANRRHLHRPPRFRCAVIYELIRLFHISICLLSHKNFLLRSEVFFITKHREVVCNIGNSKENYRKSGPKYRNKAQTIAWPP